MEDKLLSMMFEQSRWESLIDKAELKGINKAELRALCKPETRVRLLRAIASNNIEFEIAHEAAIPKDEPGEYRIVYVGGTVERVLCSLINDCLFELFPDMVHKRCTSYQKGLSTGKTVLQLSNIIRNINDDVYGAKYDFHHYFDTVNRETIMNVFDVVESKLGFEKETEPVINLLRRTYNNDYMFDLDKNLIQKWSGVRQGNAVGSWLADVVLYELDEFMSNKYKFYVRYSDDLIVIGNDVEEITNDINNIVTKYGVSLNHKKTEILQKGKWFKFLGFSLKDDLISLSKRRIKDFQKEIESRTTQVSYESALYKVKSYLYKGEYPWSNSVLSVINSEQDIQRLNSYVMDSLRAAYTGKHKIYGLGYDCKGKDGVIPFATGKNVKKNREKLPHIDGYVSLMAYKKAPRDIKEALALQM